MRRQIHRRRRLAAAALTAAVLVAATAVAPAGAVTSQAPTARSGPVSATDLSDSGPQQQGWLSAPGSRLTLNPGNPQYPGLKGRTLPLSTEFFGYGAEGYQDPLLQQFTASSPTPPEGGTGGGEPTLGLEETFDDLTTRGWTADNVQLEGVDGAARVTTRGDWGKISSAWLTVDLATNPMLTVDVGGSPVGNTGKWALKLQPASGSDRVVQVDTPDTGSFTYDLSQLASTSDLVTTQATFQVYLFVSGGSNRTVDFQGLRIWGSPTTGDPEQGQSVGFADDMGTASMADWAAADGRDLTYSSDGTNGAVTLQSGDWGAVRRTVTVDVDENPALTVRVASTTGQWALKVREPGGGEVELQHDTPVTGTRTYDLRGATGWGGTRTFEVLLYQVGSQTSTVFERVSVHGETRWLEPADDYTSTWSPQSINYTTTHGSAGTVSGYDLPVGKSALGRLVEPDLSEGVVAVTGRYTGTARWDTEAHALFVTSGLGAGRYTWALTYPEGTRPLFFTSSSDLARGSRSLEVPSSGQGYWAATLPGDTPSAVGAGFALGDDEAARGAALDAAREADTPAELEAQRAAWTTYWDEFLAKVPVPQDFALHGEDVNPEGVTAEQVEQLYFRAWVGLQANVMDATPETGGQYRQIATGKPSTYASGPKGAEASAAWDSLFGMQFLAYVDPDLAWEAFHGNMENAVPAEGHYGEYETLPSRKAQTAWVLYQVTGQRAPLQDSYATMVDYLDWASRSENMRWSFSGKGEGERDAEFYVSMIVDLGYAQKIARLLGHAEDAESWAQTAAELVQEYEDLFFPEDGRTLYKHWVDGAHPDETGLTQYVATGLHVPGLSTETISALQGRFRSAFDVNDQLAGLANDDPSAVKAPDAQFITYGLLDQGMVTEAEQVIHILTRDIARAGVFAEVYSVGEDGPRGGSVAPSIFGNIHLIDNVWMANGVRMDQGDPAFVRLPSATGGVAGLSHLGLRYDADVDGTTLRLEGAAVEAGTLPPTADLTTAGQTVLPRPEAELVHVESQTRCLAGMPYVAVRVENTSDRPVRVEITTDVGSKTFAEVAPDANAYQAFRARGQVGDVAVAVTARAETGAPQVVREEVAVTTC